MKRKLLYIINPISGTRNKANLESTIIRKTKAAGFAYDIVPTMIDGNYSSLREAVRTEKITDVVVCGGDGSVSSVAAALLGIDVNIGIIPMGSGNGLALAAGISVSMTKALDIIHKGRSAFIDGFTINDKFSCMMCGVGSDAQVAHDFAGKTRRGLKTYLQISAGQFFRAKTYAFTLELPDSTVKTQSFFISIANSNQFGNHITIAPQASLQDGLLDLVVVNKMSKVILPFQLLNQMAGNNRLRGVSAADKRNIFYFQTERVVIHNHDLAPLHIDGEPQPAAERIEIAILPGAFKLLQPFV